MITDDDDEHRGTRGGHLTDRDFLAHYQRMSMGTGLESSTQTERDSHGRAALMTMIMMNYAQVATSVRE